LPYLYTQMVADAEYVTPIVVTAVAVTANAANTGYGTTAAATLVTCILRPGTNGTDGGDDQRVRAESLRMLCTDDLTTASRVQYELVGQPVVSVYNAVDAYGSGRSNVVAADTASIINNGQFDNWTSDAISLPVGWTCLQATAGGNIVDVPNGGLRVHDSLKLVGDSATGVISLLQNVPLQPMQPYLVSVWLKKNGTLPTGSALAVRVTNGAGQTVYIFNADPNTLTTSYVNYKAVVNFKKANGGAVAWVELTSANGLGSTNNVQIADFIVAPMTVQGHVGYAMLPGTSNSVVGDNWGVVTAITGTPGVIQSFFTRFYAFQLPSTGTTLIADSLGT
jgi:hypothetical protein